MAARMTMSLRPLAAQPAAIARASLLPRSIAYRSFQTSRRLQQDSVVSPRRPIGAFRGSLFGFLLGTVLAGSGLYYYVVEEYKVANELLVQDIYTLQAAVQRLEGYVKGVEDEAKTKSK